MSDQWRFVVAAYTITWIVLIGYAAYVELQWRRARKAANGGES